MRKISVLGVFPPHICFTKYVFLSADAMRIVKEMRRKPLPFPVFSPPPLFSPTPYFLRCVSHLQSKSYIRGNSQERKGKKGIGSKKYSKKLNRRPQNLSFFVLFCFCFCFILFFFQRRRVSARIWGFRNWGGPSKRPPKKNFSPRKSGRRARLPAGHRVERRRVHQV